jgi:hypothetical protein
MLSEALQRNAKHEARLSNISDLSAAIGPEMIRDFHCAHNDIRKWLLMLLCDVSVNFLVVPAGVFFLSFPKRYVVCNTANSSVRLRIIFSYLERDTHWPGRDATRPIKLDVPCANVLFGFLHGIGRIPGRIRSNAKPSSDRQCENA